MPKEYIDRKALQEMLNAKAEMAQGTPKQVFYAVAKMVELLPAADVVPVVRCKDCVNRVEFDTNKFHCELTGYYCGERGYCSDGRKRTSD